MPHIKTYSRLDIKNGKIGWYLLTSANLSKAAWGDFQKTGLFIRSYELGVLTFDTEDIRLPFDLPLKKYTPEDECWRWDVQVDRPDMYGETRNC
jgi:tyrosyl-DNA phosphodiesterase-1